MKSVISILFYCLQFLTLAGISSCNRHIDKTTTERKVQVMQGSLTFFKDSNVLIYNSKVGLRADMEVLKPMPFYTPIPKGLKWFEISNPESFAFYYKKGQAISIVIDLSDSTTKRDSVYEPSKAEIEKYFIHFTADAHQKYNMWNIGYKQERKQLIIKKDAATILLYNITPKNHDLFVEYLKEFKFL
jgi:hypothetical protein